MSKCSLLLFSLIKSTLWNGHLSKMATSIVQVDSLLIHKLATSPQQHPNCWKYPLTRASQSTTNELCTQNTIFCSKIWTWEDLDIHIIYFIYFIHSEDFQSILRSLSPLMFINILSLTRWNANWCYSLRTMYLIFEAFQILFPTASLICTAAKLFHQVIWERMRHKALTASHP